MKNNRSYNDVQIKKEDDEFVFKNIVFKSVNGVRLEPSAPRQALNESFQKDAEKRIRGMVRELGDRAVQHNSSELLDDDIIDGSLASMGQA